MQNVQLGDHYIKTIEINGKFPHVCLCCTTVYTDIQTCQANQTVRVRARAACAV